jgi:NAD(P)-dependent dehydrogenase (short-subunit alcohol dehydrogenase family)
MSKAALNMLTKSLSIELKRKNIITISLYPGAVKTDFTIPYQKNIKNILNVEEATLKHF